MKQESDRGDAVIRSIQELTKKSMSAGVMGCGPLVTTLNDWCCFSLDFVFDSSIVVNDCRCLSKLIPDISCDTSTSTLDASIPSSSILSSFSALISSLISCRVSVNSSLYRYRPLVSSVNRALSRVSMWYLSNTESNRSWIATYVSSSPNSLLWRFSSSVLYLSRYPLVLGCILLPRSYGDSLYGRDPLFRSSLRRTASSSTWVPSKLMRLSYGFLVVAGGAMAVKLIFVCCVGSFRPLFFYFSFFFLLSVVGMVASFCFISVCCRNVCLWYVI